MVVKKTQLYTTLKPVQPSIFWRRYCHLVVFRISSDMANRGHRTLDLVHVMEMAGATEEETLSLGRRLYATLNSLWIAPQLDFSS